MKTNMYENFSKLESRVFDSLSKTDLVSAKKILSSISGPTLVSGVGGSNIVSDFLSKVLSVKNNIICENTTPRDLVYKNLNSYKNVITCSYSGNNLGVFKSFDNNLNKYLLSRKTIEGVTNINYVVDDIEKSFISLSSTLIPMSIILLYYCDDINIIKEILSYKPIYDSVKWKEILVGYEQSECYHLATPTTDIDAFVEELATNWPLFNTVSSVFEIISGYETSTSTKFIESTMTEAGIGVPVVHDKYDYCHGRSTLTHRLFNNLIFFDGNSELDEILRKEVNRYYNLVIKIAKKYDDEIINDFYLTYVSMLLCRSLAGQLEIDLSNVDYSPIVKKLYYFKGEM